MGKFKKDYVDDMPYIGFTSNANQVNSMGIVQIPAEYTDSTYTVKMAFSEIVRLMQNNICVSFVNDPANGIQNDFILFANYSEYKIFLSSGAELTAADANSYPTNGE